VVPAQGLASQTIPVTWTESNNGDGSAVGPWTDAVYLASDAEGDNPQLLGLLPVSGTLAPGQSVTRALSVAIPPTVAGNEWIVVRRT